VKQIEDSLFAKQENLALTSKHFLPLLFANEDLWLSGEAEALSAKIHSLNRLLTMACISLEGLNISLFGDLSPALPVPQYG
jgi:hypothetical protein